MTRKANILAIDQGTTSSRAMVFDATGKPVRVAQKEFAQHYPHDGWVEHDPEEIWSTTLDVCREAIAGGDVDAKSVAAIGITNQRETTLVWDRGTGKPVYRAIVWQDRRTAEQCDALRAAGHEDLVARKAGLLLDPYFSATKIAWILDNVDGARAKAERGDLAFGTVDCFLLWRLTGGRVHATDATNASRTMLFDIHSQSWDEELLDLFRVPRGILPEVRDCAAHFGETQAELLGRTIPVTGIAGDQQAAAVGQACFSPGMIKSTYGTGCFVLVNTGDQAVRSRNRLLTTVCYRLEGKVTYALEGSIFIAGAAVQWLRDGLGLIQSAPETEALASSLPDNRGVYLVPAFTGLGAPYWDAHARGGLFGITRDTGVAEIVRATLESVCYQTRDLLEAVANDGATSLTALRVDGGMVANDWLMQFLADIVDLRVERPVVTETTALGAAYLAGVQSGVFDSLDDVTANWRRDRSFEPRMDANERERLVAGWSKAVSRIRTS
ncbi:MAG: glycerol kinase GlpK [Gammaproteobacteria bacterium]|nr:MAG: glycerol kinase GlpK [Gammaproteobacteria bacterium]